MTHGARTVVAALVFGGALLAPAYAQDSPAVRAAVQLAAGGQSDSARRLVDAELARARPGQPAYVEALYWRARLAAAADTAERDLRRVALEFSNSAWADDALLQLAQLALTARNPAATVTYVLRLRADYPSSDLRARAAYWGGRAAFDAGDPAAACALLDSARAESPGDVEFQNQVRYYRSRCGAVTSRAPAEPARTDPAATPPAPTAAAPAPPAAETGRGWRVQAAATRSQASAQSVVARLARAGLTAHVEAGSDGYFRVRLGPFATRDAAESTRQAAARAIGGRPYLVRP